VQPGRRTLFQRKSLRFGEDQAEREGAFLLAQQANLVAARKQSFEYRKLR
jgi:hypothetical protein